MRQKRIGVFLIGFFLLSLISILDQPTVLAQISNTAYFPVGPGFTDGIPRQIVRTREDRVYLFAPRAQTNNQVNVFWTTGTGLPSSTNAFNGSTSFTETAFPLSVDAVYDGASTIHVLINTNGGSIKDYPFDTTTNTFRSPITLATGVPQINGDYIGTVGVSGMFDATGNLHVAYWTNTNHITHRAYTYNVSSNVLTPVSAAVQVDSDGSANHPAVAVSPLDNSVTVAWVSEATSPARILARTRSSSGTWGSVENVSTAPVWISRNSGVNIDQGPSVIITPNGVKHLTYIENWDSTNNYGRVHYVTNTGSGWQDTALSFYSHNPGLATNGAGGVYMIGHGAVQTGENENLYILTRNSNGTWSSPQLFATGPESGSFDASPSIKWSILGFNRPETIEFAFFTAIGDNYYNTTLYYGRFTTGASTTPSATPVTPTITPSPVTPTATPVTPTSVPSTATSTVVPATATQTPTVTPSNTPNASGDQRLTVQVSSGNDDVNEVSSSLTTNSSTVWVGNGGSTTSSFAGLRFSNVSIPQGALITSASLELHSSQSQWINLALQLAGDNTDDSSGFSASALPSQRSLTVSRVNHATDESWSANTWYALSEVSPLLQEIVNRPGWRSGNDLSLIIRGASTGTWGRKFAYAFEQNPGLAPRLVITFRSSGGGGSTPVNTATPLPSATPMPTASHTPIPATPTASRTPSMFPETRTLSILMNSDADDVNEVNGVLEPSAGTVWIGNGGSTTTSYAGFRFNNVLIPPGATIVTAYLEFYSAQSQWNNLGIQIAAEATNNSSPFSPAFRPSQRPLTAARVNHTSNVAWAANTWYSFDEMAPVVREVISRAGWQSGNSISFILRGTSTGSWGRKFVRSFEAGAPTAVRLIVTYQG